MPVNIAPPGSDFSKKLALPLPLYDHCVFNQLMCSKSKSLASLRYALRLSFITPEPA